jgi:hypothetical protein
MALPVKAFSGVSTYLLLDKIIGHLCILLLFHSPLGRTGKGESGIKMYSG